MQKTNEDCFYFLTSTCAKGSTCAYRHNPTVRTCNVICPAWSRGNCIDPTCSLRHSTIQQRSTINNGITCFYESTPMGCLKLDCSFVHVRSRTNLRNSPTPRPSTTNLVNKDIIKSSPVINEPVQVAQTTPVLTVPSKVEPTPTPKVETPSIIKSEPPPVPKVETPPTIKSEPPPVPKIEVPPSTKVETPSVSVNSPSVVKPTESTTRNVAVNSSEKISDDSKKSTRTVVNRNVVIGDSNRKVVQASRLVVSSTKSKHDSDSDLEDLIEQENEIKKTNGVIDILFPCSAPSITNRLFMSSKSSTTTTTTNNNTKPIRLNRDFLPATKVSSPNIVSLATNGEKSSAGTELPQEEEEEEERRINRIERFKKKPISPTRSVVNSSSNERKRPASDQMNTDLFPSKRPSSEQDLNRHQNSTATIGELCSPPTSPRRTHTRHHRRRRRRSSPSPSPPPPPSLRKSPLRQTYSATSSMNDSTWKKEVDEFLAKTTQPKPVPLLSLRPRYVPPPAQRQPPPPPPPQLPLPLMPRSQPRQPPSVPVKRPAAPVITPPEVTTKPPEPTLPTPTPPITNSKDEDENRLLGLNEPTDVVDAFAFIDEVLLETDDFLELM